MTLDEHKQAIITTLTEIRDLCVEAESYEEVTDIDNLIKRTEIATDLEQVTQILLEAMVYNRMAKNSFLERNKNK